MGRTRGLSVLAPSPTPLDEILDLRFSESVVEQFTVFVSGTFTSVAGIQLQMCAADTVAEITADHWQDVNAALNAAPAAPINLFFKATFLRVVGTTDTGSLVVGVAFRNPDDPPAVTPGNL